MVARNPNSLITDTQELEFLARTYLDIFFRQTALYPLPATHFEIDETTRFDGRQTDPEFPGPILFFAGNQTLTITIDSGTFLNATPQVLRGGLGLQLAGYVLGLQPDMFRLNFRKDILPLLWGSGSVVQFLRRLVLHLEGGLRTCAACRFVMDLEYGADVVAYMHNFLQSLPLQKSDYQRYLPHRWMRAIFIARKSAELTPLELLDSAGQSAGLGRFWRDYNDYLLSEDKALVEEQVSISKQFEETDFTRQVIAMFRVIKDRLLI